MPELGATVGIRCSVREYRRASMTEKSRKVEQNKANSTDEKRHLPVGWVMDVCMEKAVGGEDDGKWQLGVSRRR